MPNQQQFPGLQENSGLYAESMLLQESSSIHAEWTELARNAIEPNPFYEPEYLLAVQKHLLPNEVQHLIVIWSGDSDRRLVGLFPVSVRWLAHGFLFPVTSFTFDSLIGVCTPLISGPQPEKVWQCFLNFLAVDPNFPEITFIREFYADSPCGNALSKATGKVVQTPEYEFHRAVAHCDGSFADYTAQWSKKKARNIRSRRKKLATLGALTFENISQNDEHFKTTLNSILELEAAGWKGKKGTALTCKSRTRDFARQAFEENCSKPTIHLAIMRLDDRIIAGQINLVAQDHAFFMKSAYDETLHAYGPGVILYTWVQEQAFDQNLYLELDSCADANHSLEEIWLERRRVQALFIAVGSAKNTRVISWMVNMRKLLKTLRNKLLSISKKLMRSG